MNLRKVVSLILLAIACIGVPLSAQEHYTEALKDDPEPASDFMVSLWRASDGLPANEIHDLEITRDGYLWLGTHQGLVRFDGVRFETFFNDPTGARYGTHVSPLEVDENGELWLAPDQVGIVRRRGSVFQEVLTKESIMRARAVDLCSDRKGNVYWVDANGKLGRVSTQDPKSTAQIRSGTASNASRWVRDTDGKVWLISPRGLKQMQNGQWREIPVPGTSPMIATARRAGGLWIARDARLRFVTAEGLNGEIAEFPWKGQSRVTCLLEDARGRLWIGTVGQGLFCYDAGEFRAITQNGRAILCLTEDAHGNIWAGTRGSGLVRVRERRFQVHGLRSGLKSEFVRSLCEDKEGRLWIATTEGGLGWWQNGSWYNVGEESGWRGQEAHAICPSRQGLWISSGNRTLWRWSEGKVTQRTIGQRNLKEAAVDLLEDRKGRLWMVTDNSGLYCLEGNRLRNYTEQDGLPSALMRRIIEDETGQIWAGDWQGGIARFEGKRWEMVRKPSGHRDAVRSMVAIGDTLWIGTSAGGLLRLRKGETARVTVEHGLPNSCIQQLLVDAETLWGGTPHRLFRLSLAELNAVADRKESRLTAITYGRSDGLPDVSFGSWSDPRCWRSTNGELWFATANGAIHFQPEQLHRSDASQVLIEQTMLDGKAIEASTLKRLRPGHGRVEFRFTAPCLTSPERVRFRYQLTGVDRDWVEAGPTRTATYANIPPGNHTFRVVASNPEGVWNPEAATIGVAVHPFFWQTNFFFAAIAAVAAGGGVWIVRRATVRRLNRRLERLRQERALERERARIAQDIHDELGANLTSIGLLADLGNRHKANPDAVAKELEQISSTARESVAAMDAIVWALNPRNDSIDNFANYLAQFTRDFFRPTNIKTRLELPTDLPQHPLAMETRHQLFLIVKETFNNIVRHARATEVRLSLAVDGGFLQMRITDNGQGLSPKTQNEGGNGLSNLRNRIERLGGTLWIETRPGEGTKMEFHLPLPKSQHK